MGKFFDAMQRAARGGAEPEIAGPESASSLPELDESLLSQEWVESDVFEMPDDSQLESAEDLLAPVDTSSLAEDSPSAVIRSLESKLKVAEQRADLAQRSAERPEATGRLDPVQIIEESGAVAGTLKTRPMDMLREPVATIVRVHPAYDRIVQRLINFRRTPRQSVIMVTSAVSGEGASTVARNLACAFSQAGTEQVLLVDANMRTPSQHGVYAVPREMGLSDVLSGESSLASCIEDDVGTGISLLTCGSQVKSPSQVMTGAAIQGVVDREDRPIQGLPWVGRRSLGGVFGSSGAGCERGSKDEEGGNSDHHGVSPSRSPGVAHAASAAFAAAAPASCIPV